MSEPDKISCWAWGREGNTLADLLSAYGTYEVERVVQPSDNTYDFAFFEEKIVFNLSKSSQSSIVLLSGQECIIGSLLRSLETIKDRDIEIAYFIPDQQMLSVSEREQERFVRGVLQEYARSGLFKRIYLFDYSVVERQLATASIVDFDRQILAYIANLIHINNIMKRGKPATEKLATPMISTRISTLGALDDDFEMSLAYDLKDIHEEFLYFAVPEAMLSLPETRKRIFDGIKKHQTRDENVRISYAVHKASYDKIYGWIQANSGTIQAQT